MKACTEDKKINLLNEYFNKHGDCYSDYRKQRIIKNFGNSYSDSLTEIYYYLNLLNEEENPFIGFTNLIEKIYGLDINILEVGGGIIPALSNEISKRQSNITKGSITVYDPLISKNIDYKNINLVRENLTFYDDISKYDLIIGKEPCEGTILTIDQCLDANKEMLISPCKCYDLLPEDIKLNDEPLLQWYTYVKESMMDSKGIVNTYYLDNKMNYDNPIYTRVLK